MNTDDVPMSRRKYLEIRAMLALVERNGAASLADMMVVGEAVASTALAHPEWDMAEEKTWAEWEREAG